MEEEEEKEEEEEEWHSAARRKPRRQVSSSPCFLAALQIFGSVVVLGKILMLTLEAWNGDIWRILLEQ